MTRGQRRVHGIIWLILGPLVIASIAFIGTMNVRRVHGVQPAQAVVP